MALENKLGLTSSAELVREEERISKKKLLIYLTLPFSRYFLTEHIRH